jgi:hypothetical protein
MKRNLIVLFIGSLCGTIVAYILTSSTKFNLCSQMDYACRELHNNIGDPLLYGSSALAAVFILLFIFPPAFNAWKNFAFWFLPPVIDIFVTYKGPGGGFMDPTPQPEWVYQRLAVLYIAISVVIITVSVLRRKLGKSSEPKPLSQRGKIVFWTVWTCYVAAIIGWHFFD